MIISHANRYLFVEIPVTASYAVRGELCAFYSGEPIMHKHATLAEFRKVAATEEKCYFSFATVRNPLDVVVSRYCKLKYDHKGAFSDKSSAQRLHVDYSDYSKYRFVQDTDASFETFFLKYYSHRPYGDMIDTMGGKLDFIIKYEQLQKDFAEVLCILGLKQVREIPLVNKTEDKGQDWQSYYTPKAIEIAKKTFAPFMKKWGYDYPAEWGCVRPNCVTELQFQLTNSLRGIYHQYVRYNNKAHAQVVRKLRARLLDF